MSIHNSLHHILDWDFGPDGIEKLRRIATESCINVNEIGEAGEAPIHAAVRRRRLDAIRVLLELGADIDLPTAAGKTAYAHAIRRGFTEISKFLAERGADIELNAADRLAVAVTSGKLDEAANVLLEDPGAVKTGNPEEDRLLADVAGRVRTEPVRFLIDCGAELTARGLDDGTPLHQSAWFGEPDNAAILIDAGAPLDIFDSCHNSSPLHWAVHGSRYSGDAEIRQDRYVRLVEMLLNAGSNLHYPGDDSESYLRRLFDDATEPVRNAMLGRGLSQPDD